MSQSSTTQIDVVEAIQRRLIDQVAALTPSNCYVTAQPPQEPPANADHNFTVTISPTDGSFQDAIIDGAGVNSLVEDAGVIVVLFSAIRLDRVGHDSSLILDRTRGLYALKRDILKALTAHNLLDLDGNGILANYLYPIRCDSPRAASDKKQRVGDMSITFGTDFEWDLT